MEFASTIGRTGRAKPSGAKSILIVRHGEGRGRPNPYLDLVREFAAHEDRALAGRIRVYRTGQGPWSLDGVGAVWFFLADPLEREFPDCYAEAKAIALAAQAFGIEILNHPGALGPTAKTEQLAVWQKTGIPCAKSVQIADQDELEAAFDEIRFPAILRSDLGHAQETARLCANRDEARRFGAEVRYPAALIEFIDVRAAWQAADPASLMARFHHKKRAMVYRGEVINNHLFFSNEGICGLAVSTFKDADRIRHRLTRRFNRTFQDTLSADIDYSLSPPEQAEVMARAVAVLGLDVAAVDYSTLPDGSVVLWEANPYFYMHPVKDALLGKERRLKERNWRYEDAMLRLLASAAQ